MKIFANRAWEGAWFTIPYWAILASFALLSGGVFPDHRDEQISVVTLLITAEFLLIKSRLMERGLHGWDRLAVPLVLTNVGFALVYTMLIGFYLWPEWVDNNPDAVRIMNNVARFSIGVIVLWSILEMLRVEPPNGDQPIKIWTVMTALLAIILTGGIYLYVR